MDDDIGHDIDGSYIKKYKHHHTISQKMTFMSGFINLIEYCLVNNIIVINSPRIQYVLPSLGNHDPCYEYKPSPSSVSHSANNQQSITPQPSSPQYFESVKGSDQRPTLRINTDDCEDCQFIFGDSEREQILLYSLAYPLTPSQALLCHNYDPNCYFKSDVDNFNHFNNPPNQNDLHHTHFVQNGATYHNYQRSLNQNGSRGLFIPQRGDFDGIIALYVMIQHDINFRNSYLTYPTQYFTQIELNIMEMAKKRVGNQMFIKF
jgi:hypothetical protein